MTGQGTLVVIGGTLLACAAAVFALISFAEKNMNMAIVAAIVAVACIIGTVVLYRRLGAAGRPAFEAALKSEFDADDHGWYHGSGLAIDRRRRLVLVGTREGVQRIPFDQINSVNFAATRTGPSFGGNSLLTLILLPMAISAMVHNARASGMHVVAGGSRFRIIGLKQNDADRWLSHLDAARRTSQAA